MWPVVKFAGLVGALAALLVLSSCTNQNASAKNQPGSPSTPKARASTGIEPTLSAGPQLASVSPVPGTGMTIIHMVQEGENLFHIARKYGTSVQAIAQANGLTDPTAISVGQKLIIPNIKATTEPEPTSTPTVTPTPVPPTAAPVTPVIVTATPKAPTPTIDPNATPTLTPSPSPTPIPPDNVNGVKVDQFVIMPPAVQDNVRKIFAAGQALGNDPHRFSRVGDSIIEHPHFMVKFDVGPYNLGNYAYLQDVLNYYSGSFGHDSLSVRRGLHSWSVMNPTWADKDQCQPEEGPVACELRLYKPSIMFIVLGSNDVGVPEYFRQSMDSLVQYLIQRGVVPIIGTKADRHEGPDNINNTILREIATKYNVPLWDFDAVAGTMPNRGIDPVDGTHLTFYYAHDYTQPVAFTRGHAVQDLTAVITLDKLWRVLGLNQ